EVADERLDFAGQFLRRHRRRLYDRRARSPRPDIRPEQGSEPDWPATQVHATNVTVWDEIGTAVNHCKGESAASTAATSAPSRTWPATVSMSAESERSSPRCGDVARSAACSAAI